MSKFGRVMGHGFAAFFILLGAGFVALGLNDSFNNWLDENSTCESGSGGCPGDGARTTFMILGGSFIVAGAVSGLATEFAIRKTRRLLSHMATLPGNEPPTLESLGDFLEPFGIDLSASQATGRPTRGHFLDLRNLRSGDGPPGDPGEIGNYLKSFGITIDENALRNARVVDASPASAPAALEAERDLAPSMRANSVRQTATIVRKRDRGETAGDQRLLELDLEVTPPGRVPYRVTVASLVRETLADLLIEGSTLNVRVDPNNENSVTIDWSEN